MPKSSDAFERAQRRIREAVRRDVAASGNALGGRPEPQRLRDHAAGEPNVRRLGARG